MTQFCKQNPVLRYEADYGPYSTILDRFTSGSYLAQFEARMAPPRYVRGDVVRCPDGAMHLVWSTSLGVAHVIPASSNGEWRIGWRRHFAVSSLSRITTLPQSDVETIEAAVRDDARRVADKATQRRQILSAQQARRRLMGSIQSVELG